MPISWQLTLNHVTNNPLNEVNIQTYNIDSLLLTSLFQTSIKPIISG